ncbi:MAG: hypothetical protein KDD60_06980, partial [Bdellovibrionales bacterium]|nr:hypothetical protein [Bdellovibrionales bacterium]
MISIARKFSFGRNWSDYAKKALTPERVESARKDFRALFSGRSLTGRRFLEIGFGQGLSLYLAAEAGAEVVGIDVDPRNLEAL